MRRFVKVTRNLAERRPDGEEKIRGEGAATIAINPICAATRSEYNLDTRTHNHDATS